MPGFFTCCHCGKTLPRNPRLKKTQKYCSASSCQQARKNAWGKLEYKTNISHRDKRLLSQKRCYKKRPGDAYQAQYRRDNPEYEERNRQFQRERNRKRQRAPGSKIVNTDALSLQASIDGAYALMQVTKEGKIVNTDALMVQLQALPAIQRFSPPNTG
jgi:hypothetical protein